MQKPSTSTLIPVLIIISIITGGLYFLFKPQDDTIRQPEPPESKTELKTKTDAVNPPTGQTEQVLNNKENQTDSNQYRQAPIKTTPTDPCLETIKNLDSFFLYLDTQEYIKEYQFPNGSKDFISGMINKALSHPPLHPTDKSLSSQTQAGISLYHILGHQNLLILARILINEPDHLETVFENFYNWTIIADQCPARTYAINPQFIQLYQYALFFMDSDDGRSYVNRRDTITGLLTRFYALQIIKEAQIRNIDQNNTDLTSHINSLVADIKSSNVLENKETYLKVLYSLNEGYPE
jgi:hypothetical protein